MKPFAIGRDAQAIADFWHSAMHDAYWRNGPVLNNAVSAVEMALWDIKGKAAGLPCYQLWGGRSRGTAAVYVAALEAEVADGDLTEKQAMAAASRIMRDNQYDCFDMEGTRANIRSAA